MKIISYFMRTRSVAVIALAILSILIFNGCKKNILSEFDRRISFDEGWQFHYGDLPDFNGFDLSGADWRPVDLPHDWSIEMPFSTGSEGGKSTGHFSGGTAWYYKSFILDKGMKNKRLSLYFEGVYMETEIWINGEKVFYHPYGYTSFFCNIDQYCKHDGEKNIVAVKVTNRGKNSRWYSGSGIYRHVWLEVTDKVFLEPWGLYVTTQDLSSEKAKVMISADLKNESEKEEESIISMEIFDQSGKKVGSKKEEATIGKGDKLTISRMFEVSDPEPWSVDSPRMYRAVISARSGNRYFDSLEESFGIRSIAWSSEKGFLLNSKQIKLKGGCVHHDNGLLGSAAIDRAEEKKAELLKSNGFNAVRCSHNPPSERFLSACDKIGLLVIDEAFDQWQKPKNPDDYHRFFNDWHESDIKSMVLRDRNHPSVIMWSIGNEIQERSDSSGIAIANELKSIVKKYDPSRPVTAAICEFWDNPGKTWNDTRLAFELLEIGGYNYQWSKYENDHNLFPGRIINGTESTAAERAMHWDLVEKHPYVIGDFIWTAIDYLGESGIGHSTYVKGPEKEQNFLMDWPWYNAWCGDIDITGNKKPQSALRDVLWNESRIEMLVHAPVPPGMYEKISYWGWPDELPSWNWKGNEGKDLDIRIFTRYPAVRLYLNGNLIDEKKVVDDSASKYIAHFRVKYEPGTIKATGLEGGQEKESVQIITSGNPVKIGLIADRNSLNASRNDLAYVQIVLLDKDGNIVQDSDIKLNLDVSGEGIIAAAGNASPSDMESFRSVNPYTFRGRALVIIRPSGTSGKINLKVNAPGLPEEKLAIEVRTGSNS